jgi:anti-sigma regulatory factor (Ser/Thr protein kinase)
MRNQTTFAPVGVLDQVIDGAGLLALRSAVTAHAAELVSGDRLDDVVLVAHELATNVVRHGGGHGWLRLWPADGQLVCQVSDHGPGLIDPGPEPPAPGEPGGRGLWIARRLAHVRIITGPYGTRVTAAFDIP